jgi:plastocyanin
MRLVPKFLLIVVVVSMIIPLYHQIPTANAYTLKSGLEDPSPIGTFVPGELIITLKESNTLSIGNQAELHSRMKDAVPNFEKSVKWESAQLRASLIKVKVGEELAQIKALKQNPDIESVELNTINYLTDHIISGDPNFSLQWHLNSVNATNSWHYTTGFPSIIVAVIDTGIQYTHPDLAAGIWSNDDSCTGGVDNDNNGKIDDCRGWDFVNTDNDPIDDSGHGTFVSGIIGARLNNFFGASMAPNVSLMPVKVCGPGTNGCTLQNILDGITYAVNNGADVINMSLGAFNSPCTVSMQNAVNLAYANKVVFVVAAGNQGAVDTSLDWPLCDHVISVSATDNFNYSPGYSNWVSSTDLAAPGGDSEFSTLGGVVGSLPTYSTALPNTFSSNIGSSFSAPHVSGCAALIKSLNSEYDPDFIESKLESTALDLTDGGPLFQNMATVGKDKVFGYGLLKCNLAVMGSLTVPSIPSDLAATSGDHQIALSWSAPNNGGSPITDYIVEYGPGNRTVTTAPGSSSTGCESTIDGCFIPKLSTIGVGGKVIFSNTDTAAHTFTAGTAAGGPSGEFDSGLIMAGAKFEWTPTLIGDVPYFCMVHPWMAGTITVGFEGPFTVFDDGTSAVTGATVTGLPNGVPHNFKVSAVNAIGTGLPSDIVTKYTLLDAPTNLVATAKSTTEIDLSWTAPSGIITGYKIERESPVGGGWTTIVEDTGTSSTSFANSGLITIAQYNYRVSAINLGGTSTPSTPSATSNTTVPSTITNLTTIPGNNQVALTWTTPDNGGLPITDYIVEFRSKGIIISDIAINTAPGSSSTGCESTIDGCYIPKQATIGVGGKVIFSNTDTAAHTFTAGTAADGPSGVFDSGLIMAGSTFEWTPIAPGDVPYFCMVHPWMAGTITVGPGGPFTVFDDGTSAVTGAIVTGLTNGEGYDFKVSAVNELGTSQSSNIATIFAGVNCTPSIGDWIITSSCVLGSNTSISGNITIQNNSIMIIPDGITLDVNFATHKLTIKSGSGILIKSGGKIT